MVMDYVFDYEGLNPSEKLFALAVARYWSPGRNPFPSMSTLAKKTGLTLRHLYRLKKSLKSKGLFRMRNKMKSVLQHESTTYVIDEKAVWNHYYSNVRAKQKRQEEPVEEYSYDDFDLFWKAYPANKRKAEALCKKEWRKINPNKEMVQLIMDGLERYKRSEDWQNPKYINTTLNFLKGEMWNDEIEAQPQGHQGPLVPLSD